MQSSAGVAQMAEALVAVVVAEVHGSAYVLLAEVTSEVPTMSRSPMLQSQESQSGLLVIVRVAPVDYSKYYCYFFRHALAIACVVVANAIAIAVAIAMAHALSIALVIAVALGIAIALAIVFAVAIVIAIAIYTFMLIAIALAIANVIVVMVAVVFTLLPP